jgi:hypothetical protein|nr:MAG TPA: hypothetical protein [Caudoviricetes sp.]
MIKAVINGEVVEVDEKNIPQTSSRHREDEE